MKKNERSKYRYGYGQKDTVGERQIAGETKNNSRREKTRAR